MDRRKPRGVRPMRFAFRLLIACASGVTGVLAILLIVQPGLVSAQRSWLLTAVTVMLVTSLVSTATTMIAASAAVETAPAEAAATAAGREVHGEVTKVIAQLRALVEANGNFNAVLTRANAQLPDMLQPSEVRMVISYLMIENENMRKRGTDLQTNLEQSQRQIDKLKTNLAVAEEQGLNDALTGLRNRRAFDIALAGEVATARSGAKPLCLVLADIDHFKTVNDRYGHPTGDEVLKWFARMLAGNMKGRDTVARYGGEEFAVILPQTTLENAGLLAGQIRHQLEQQLWTKPGAPNTSLRITASFGVAQLAPNEGTSGLIQRADAKLYESKASGRNRVAA